MELLEIGMIGVVAVVVVNVIAPKIRIAAPLLLVLLGIGISFLPAVAPIEIQPEWILGGILPPLLYSAAVNMPTMDFRRDVRTISAFSVLLVIGSAVVIGYVMSRLVPGIDLAVGIALGAILSPTDAVATAIVRRAGVTPRLVTVLEGESLLNDASALVLLRSATAATALLSARAVAFDFIWAVVVAVAVGFVGGRLHLFIRARISNPTSNVTISLVVPFFAYIPAEQLGGSGLVAAVVAGLVTGHGAPKYLRARDRLTNEAVWRTVEMLLESAVFLLMGLELYGLVVQVHNEHGSVALAVELGALAAILVIIVRTAFVAPALWLLSRRGRRSTAVRERIATIREHLESGEILPAARLSRVSDEDIGELVEERSRRLSTRLTRQMADLDYLSAQSLGWREGIVLVWAGMRGAVTLAAAQSLPAETPQRALLILVAFVVAAGTLMVQGGTLGWLVRTLGLTGGDPTQYRTRLLKLRRELASVLTERLDDGSLTKQDGTPFSPGAIGWARRLVVVVLAMDEQKGDKADDLRTERGQLRLAAIELQRAELLRIRNLGTYPSSVLEDTLTQLDADQLSLELRTGS